MRNCLIQSGVAGCGLICLFQAPTAVVEPVKTAPIAYFDKQCSRCHGYMGAFYGPTFGKDLTDSQLREKVRQMAAGPGGAPLKGNDLDAQVAFHRSMIGGEPFVVWTATKGQTLSGETTPDATLELVTGTKHFPVKVKDGAWSASLPANVSLRKVTLRASLHGKKSVLDLSKAAFTHSAKQKK